MSTYAVRTGDGRLVAMTADEIRRDLVDGSEDAADRGHIPTLTENEIERLLELFLDPACVVGVAAGNQVVTTQDAGNQRFDADSGSCGMGLGMGRIEGLHLMERAFAQDTVELGHIDYSYKVIKPIIAQEQAHMERALLTTVAPVFYGAMPNLGLYFSPDGPFANPSDLLPAGKVKEALEAQESASAHAQRDMVFVGTRLADSGADAINLDTTGAAGDGDFHAALNTVEQLKAKKPHLAIEVGMASEFVLGMHGRLTYKGERLAGMYPHDQVRMVELAGGDVFGPVVNTNTGRSMPWNLARSVCFVKACVEAANIPVHANVGMGVGGIPVFDTPAIDAVSRASVAMVQIARVDGL